MACKLIKYWGLYACVHAGCTATTWKSGTGPVDQGLVRELLCSIVVHRPARSGTVWARDRHGSHGHGIDTARRVWAGMARRVSLAVPGLWPKHDTIGRNSCRAGPLSTAKSAGRGSPQPNNVKTPQKIIWTNTCWNSRFYRFIHPSSQFKSQI